MPGTTDLSPPVNIKAGDNNKLTLKGVITMGIGGMDWGDLPHGQPGKAFLQPTALFIQGTLTSNPAIPTNNTSKVFIP